MYTISVHLQNYKVHLLFLIMLIKIGDNLKEARLNLGLSLTEIGKEIGLSKQTLSSIEIGTRTGRSFVLYLLFLKEKGVDMNEIFNLPKGNIYD